MSKSKLKKLLISMILSSVMIALGLSFLGKYYFLLDLFSHFWVYYLLVLIPLGIVAWRLNMKILASSALLCVLFIGIHIAPLHLTSVDTTNEKGLRIAAINLLSSNRDYDKVLAYIQVEKFDIIIFQELSFGWRRQLNKLSTTYPYQKHQAQKGNFGIGIYSRISLTNTQIYEFGQFDIPSIAANFKYKNKTYYLIGTHPVPPTNPSAFKMRNDQMTFVNGLVRKQEAEAIVVGDMNCTSFSPNFSLLTEGTTLRDTRAGFGACTSWEATIPFIAITIDHALVTDGIRVKHRGVGPYIGSDHFPLELTIY